MKLLMPSHQTFKTPKDASLLARLFAVIPSAFTEANIDFEGSPVMLGVRYQRSVAFGTKLYQGIVPLKHLYDHVYVCRVDCVTEIEIAVPHESPVDIW